VSAGTGCAGDVDEAAAPAAPTPAAPTPLPVMLADVLHGLRPDVRKVSPKYFYDDVGARLFEEITTLDEYYPTRTEAAILRAHAGAMAQAIGPGARVVEFGSGSGEKTRLLLRQLIEPAAYVPVDIACEQLDAFAGDVRREFPELRVAPLCADYMQPLQLPAATAGRRTVAFFPGSTIGNLEPEEAAAFLERVARGCGEGGGLLLGTDMHKDTRVLERAYNDEAGVTAAFNLNMLARFNRELGTGFDMDVWRHAAFYDEAYRRIEMRVVASADTVVTVPGPDGAAPARFAFAAGEWITTEYSHKYTPDDVRDMAARTGWEVTRLWTDPDAWFAVWLLTSTGRR
jgi:L-histidine Nalpha-methyltransferase